MFPPSVTRAISPQYLKQRCHALRDSVKLQQPEAASKKDEHQKDVVGTWLCCQRRARQNNVHNTSCSDTGAKKPAGLEKRRRPGVAVVRHTRKRFRFDFPSGESFMNRRAENSFTTRQPPVPLVIFIKGGRKCGLRKPATASASHQTSARKSATKGKMLTRISPLCGSIHPVRAICAVKVVRYDFLGDFRRVSSPFCLLQVRHGHLQVQVRPPELSRNDEPVRAMVTGNGLLRFF